jgi:hypothetical protein
MTAKKLSVHLVLVAPTPAELKLLAGVGRVLVEEPSIVVAARTSSFGKSANRFEETFDHFLLCTLARRFAVFFRLEIVDVSLTSAVSKLDTNALFGVVKITTQRFSARAFVRWQKTLSGLELLRLDLAQVFAQTFRLESTTSGVSRTSGVLRALVL